jgi:hypothetical protein
MGPMALGSDQLMRRYISWPLGGPPNGDAGSATTQEDVSPSLSPWSQTRPCATFGAQIGNITVARAFASPRKGGYLVRPYHIASDLTNLRGMACDAASGHSSNVQTNLIMLGGVV